MTAALRPPPLAVAEAGLLLDPRAELRHTAGTLVELHHLGVLRIEEVGRSSQRLVLAEPAAAAYGHQRALVAGLFPRSRPGEVRELRRGDGRLTAAHTAMRRELLAQVADYGWYARMPGRRLWSWSDGTLTAEGQAQAGRVLAFAQHLASARLEREALVRLLPWALVAGLGARWQELVQEHSAGNPGWWAAAGMFGIDRFRRGVAGIGPGTPTNGADVPGANDGVAGD